MPSVASTDPIMEVNLRPILSLRIPTRKERKNVVPIVRLPIKAADVVLIHNCKILALVLSSILGK